MAAPAYPSIRLLKTDEVLRMVDAGILGEDEPVELLDGVLVEMSPQGPIHAGSITAVAERLRGVYAGRASVREDKPVTAGPYSLPEPDIAVVRGRVGDYFTAHPSGADVVLAVELAWSSHAEDRRKAAIYAAAFVPVYWLVDLKDRRVEVRTNPQGGAYTSTQILAETDVVSLPELDVRWSVRDLLP